MAPLDGARSDTGVSKRSLASVVIKRALSETKGLLVYIYGVLNGEMAEWFKATAC